MIKTSTITVLCRCRSPTTFNNCIISPYLQPVPMVFTAPDASFHVPETAETTPPVILHPGGATMAVK